MVSSFVVMIAGDIIAKCPVAGGAVNEMAKIIGFSGPKPRNPAGFAMLPPHLWIEHALGIQRPEEDISHSRITKGVLGLPRELEPDLPEVWRQA
jgi:hypothetical protein